MSRVACEHYMEQDREYAVTKGRIIPVDFQNSGVMELLNKKIMGRRTTADVEAKSP